jgi:long-chain fatty acid transport protein
MHRTPHLSQRSFALCCGLFLASLVLASLAPGTARASSTLEIIGATTGGNQITARVLSHGSAATYFNPSLLPEATPKLEAGFFGLAVQSNIRLKARPAGVDVPSTIYNSSFPLGTYSDPTTGLAHPLATKDLPHPRSNTDADDNVIYASIGLVRPLAGKALVFGFYAFLPVRAFLNQNGFFADEHEQFFSNQLHPELLGDRLNVSSIAFALGSQLNDWISLGAGIDVAIFTQSKVGAYVSNASDQSQVLLSPDIHTDSKFEPYLATTVHPTARSSVIATLHFAFANTTKGENDLLFPVDPTSAGSSAKQSYWITQGSEPLRFALGGSYSGRRLPDGRAPWEIGIQLLGERWSQYYKRLYFDSKDVYGRPLDTAHPLDTWKNTVSVAVGGGFLWRDRHVTADLGYVPSPVPDQTGRTNYVDNSRLVASAGIEGPVKFLGRDLEAGITLFGAYLLPREVTKDPNAAHPVLDEYPDTATDSKTGLPDPAAAGLQTNNPGYPGWKSTGYMIGAGATFRIAR